MRNIFVFTRNERVNIDYYLRIRSETSHALKTSRSYRCERVWTNAYLWKKRSTNSRRERTIQEKKEKKIKKDDSNASSIGLTNRDFSDVRNGNIVFNCFIIYIFFFFLLVFRQMERINMALRQYLLLSNRKRRPFVNTGVRADDFNLTLVLIEKQRAYNTVLFIMPPLLF